MEAVGIDIGGTGIKAARVDTRTGAIVSERLRFLTPDPSTPARIAKVVGEAARRLGYEGPVGCGFPGVVRGGVIRSAANVSKKWVGVRGAELLQAETGLEFFF
ncbi:MAG TPA: ROK family protein, partial [Vicinamibacteria bacterium]